MKAIISFLVIMFVGFGVPVMANNSTPAISYNFAKHNGKTIKNIACSPNGKLIFIRFTDGTSIQIRANQQFTVKEFGGN